MDKRSFIVLPYDEGQYKEIMQNVVSDAIIAAFEKMAQNEQKVKDEVLLSRKETADLYGISLVTLRAWEKDGIIPKPIRMGSRVYWPKSVIMNDIKNK